MPSDEFTDVDFRYAVPPGKALGCLPQTIQMMAAATPDVQPFGINKLIPQSEWPALAEQLEQEIRDGVWDVKDQSNEGSCVGNATVACMQYRMMMAMGAANSPRLSAMSIYKPISGGPNTGAYISDGAKQSSSVGALPEPGQGYTHEHPAIGWRQPLPSGFQETAKLFRADWELANSRDQIFSACFQYKPTLVGRRGHAIAYLLPKYERGSWYIGYVNSWGDWGEPFNDEIPYGLGWDTWGNMATDGYICENVTIRSEVELPL